MADENSIVRVIRWILSTGVDGIGPFEGSEDLAGEYREDSSYSSTDERVTALIRWETTKSYGVGFATGLPGLLTLPVTIPTNMYASWAIQGRLAGAVACLYGHAVDEERVRTLILLSILGNAGLDILKKAGIDVTKRVLTQLVKEIPGKVLIEINKQVGFRLITKAGTRGVINISRAVPVVGGFINGGVDAFACFAVGRTARRVFYTPGAGLPNESGGG